MVKFQKKIPERIIEDRESLYDSNIKLKEKIKDLEKENIKLKTKAHVSEK